MAFRIKNPYAIVHSEYEIAINHELCRNYDPWAWKPITVNWPHWPPHFFWTVTALSFEFASKRVGSLAVNMIRLTLAF